MQWVKLHENGWKLVKGDETVMTLGLWGTMYHAALIKLSVCESFESTDWEAAKRHAALWGALQIQGKVEELLSVTKELELAFPFLLTGQKG